jgi:hypothetical protein
MPSLTPPVRFRLEGLGQAATGGRVPCPAEAARMKIPYGQRPDSAVARLEIPNRVIRELQ